MEPPPGLMPEGCTGYSWSYVKETKDGTVKTNITWKFKTKDGEKVVQEKRVEGENEEEDTSPEAPREPSATKIGRAFRKADKKKSGKLTQVELLDVLLKLKVNEDQAREYVVDFSKRTDHHGDGELDYEHFIDEFVRMKLFQMNKSLKKTFKKADTNNDGTLSSKEAFSLFRKVLGKESPLLLQDLWVKLDANGDGKVDFEEFQRFCTHQEGEITKKHQKKLEGPSPKKGGKPYPDELNVEEAKKEAAKAGNGGLNEKIIQWLLERLNKICLPLNENEILIVQTRVSVTEALTHCGAGRPWSYKWFGKKVSLEEALPGDVVTFHKCKMEWRNGWQTAGMPDHAAVVFKVDPQGTLKGTGKMEFLTLESNCNHVLNVLHNYSRIGCKTQGKIQVWRPMSSEAMEKDETYLKAKASGW